MTRDPTAYLEELIAEILEQLAFCEVERKDRGFAGWSDEDLRWTEIALLAPYTDHMTIALPGELAEMIAGDAWGGLDDDDQTLAVADFLNELINTLAGQLLARLNPGQPISLGLPEAGRGPREVPSGRSLYFDVEGQPLCVSLKHAA
ncbi:MAG: chemotaxis protein CheX [Myxococcota bacterium]